MVGMIIIQGFISGYANLLVYCIINDPGYVNLLSYSALKAFSHSVKGQYLPIMANRLTYAIPIKCMVLNSHLSKNSLW